MKSQQQVTWAMYFSHTLSSVGDRMWGFSVGLYLVILYPESLMVTAIFGVSNCIVVILFGSTLGTWIDRNERLKVAITSLFVDNGFVMLGSTLLCLNLIYKDEIPVVWTGLQPALYAGIIICAVINNLGSTASNIVIERDWIVVVSDGDQEKLSKLNSTMRSIDLTTHIVAPFVMGQIITFGSPFAGAAFIGIWNLISLVLEYFLLHAIYKSVPQLSEKIIKTEEMDKPLWNFWETHDAWKLYFNHPIRFAGIGFALLFMTVMGFDSITLGYIYGQGGTESFIGIMTGSGAVIGIIACLCFPYLHSKLGGNVTGILGFGLNVVLLMLCVGSIFGPGSPFDVSALLYPFSSPNPTQEHQAKSLDILWTENPNVFYFVAGVVLGRFGLWVADLSVTQIIQESTVESQRGVVNGVQNSLNQLFDLLKFILVVIIPSVEGFGYLVFLSWIAMLISLGCFLNHTRLNKGGTESRNLSMDELTQETLPLLLQK